jgi:hypothetical protein
MANTTLRDRARRLRSRGEGIGSIAKQLETSKSTVSYWCRDIALTREQQHALAKHQSIAGAIGRLHAAENKRAARLAAITSMGQLGAKDVGKLSARDIRMIGLGLYWGEGSKNGNDECGITNSDPGIILAFLRWVRNAYDIPLSDLILRVSVNSLHRTRIQDIERYWSHVTGVPRSQFTKPSFIKTAPRKVYENTENHFGTLRVKIRRGTALRRRILGSLAKIRTDINRGT